MTQPSTPIQLDLHRSVDALSLSMSDSDRRLAQVLLSDPTSGSYLSANEAARRAQVHPATAVRFARKLGYENYTALRNHLREQLRAEEAAPGERMRHRLDRASGSSLVQSLVDSEVRVLQALPEQLKTSQLEAAAGLLLAAKRILVCGTGHASIVAALLGMRLARGGLAATALDRTDWRAVDFLAGMGKGDVLLAVVLRVQSKSMRHLMEAAHRHGIRIVVIADLPKLLPQPDVVLAAARGGAGETQSLTIPMAICNLLIMAIAQADDGESIRALDRLGQMRSELHLLD